MLASFFFTCESFPLTVRTRPFGTVSKGAAAFPEFASEKG